MMTIGLIACCAMLGMIGFICAYSNKAIDDAFKTGYQKGKTEGYSQGWNDRDAIAKTELLIQKAEHLLEGSKND